MTDFLTELREELLDGLEGYERAPRWPGRVASRGRRLAVPAARRIAAVAVIAAATVAVAVQVASRAPDREQAVGPPVSRLEGFHATAAVVADGSLWVTEYDVDQLLRIDLATGKVRARIDVGGSPGAVIATPGAVWVHDWEHGRLLKVDARTNRVVATLPVGSTNGDVAFAAGAVWAVDPRGELLRVDPDTAEVTRHVPLGVDAPLPSDTPAGSTLAVAGDTLWVLAADGRVAELDARTGRIVGRARGPVLPPEKSRRVGADGSGLWISSPYRREVVLIDARTRRTTYVPIHGDPGALAVVDGRIWVATLHDTGTLSRVTVLDADGKVVATLPLPPQAAVNIVPSPSGDAWVTFGADNTVSPAALRLPGTP
jgi:virginiamycin B lyase